MAQLHKEQFKEIVERFVELKDTSELMMDLAYSSLLLNRKDLAEEVQELEEHVDELHTEFELLVLSSGFKPEESKDFLGLIRLGVVTEKIADAAAQQSHRRAFHSGVKIAFGTDAGCFPHGQNAREFVTLVEWGMPPLEAIRAATLNAADLLGVTDRGVISPGKLADIIAVPGNPLEDVRRLQQVCFVMKGGLVVKTLVP